MFGGTDSRFYTPYTAEQYLRSAGVVTIVRVLGLAGYQADTIQLVAFGGTSATLPATKSIAVLAPSRGGTNGTGDLSQSSVTGSWSSLTLNVQGSNVSRESYGLSFDTSSLNFVDKVISPDAQSEKSGVSGSSVYVYKVYRETAHAVFGGAVTVTPSASAV